MSPITPIATYLLYLTLSIPNSHFCTHKDRIAPTTTENKPVCALYSGDCASVSGFCQKTFLNAQAACHDNNVLIYTTGECNQASVQACPASESNSQEVVCSFSVQRRLGGVSEEALKSSVSAHEACKSDSTAFFVKSDCSAAGNTGNICTKDKRAEASRCTPSTEAISCVYYAGGDCQAELCRKTQKTDCSLCQDMSVLFFTEGACEDSAKTVELERSLYVVQPEVPNGFTVPHDDSGVEETEANIEQNGSLDLTVDDAGVEPVIAPEDDPNGLDLSNDVPDVEAETLADGTIMLTPVVSQDDPNGLDLSVDDAGVEPEVAPEDDPNGWDLSNDVPEVEAKTLEDGTIELTPVAPQDDVNGLDLTHDDSGVEETEANDNDQNNGYDLSNDVPEVEAKTLEDGIIELTPVEPKIAPEDDPNGWDLSNDDANDEPEVAPEDDPNGWDLSNDDAVVETETLVDGPVEAYPVNIKNSGLAPEDDPNGWDLSNDDDDIEPEVAPEDDPNGWDLSNDDANDEPKVAPEDDPNGWDLSNDDAGVEPEVQTENTQPETEKKPKPSSPYNTHNFKFNAIPLENSNEAFKAELSNGMTVASFQEPSEEN